jgi:6,7-dimethyl-8-ribityllumazine synthase
MQPEIKLAIVVAEFNENVTERMLKQALNRAKELHALTTYVSKTPGSYDIPLLTQTLLEKEDVDAVVALGAIVQGGTGHDEVIANALAEKLAGISLQFKKPVTLGVAGPRMSMKQAQARASDYANRSVEAAVKMVQTQRALSERIEKPTYPVVVG